jgi:hypothetical protein
MIGTAYDDHLDAADLATLRAWVATFGDSADVASVRARVRLLLALRAMHPWRATLDEVLDDTRVRAVLCASVEGRPWAMKQYRRWCTRVRRM